MSLKITWRVSPAPVGKYRSFEDRSWPYADYPDGTPLARIYCEDSYTPTAARTSLHAPLRVDVADHSVVPWKWRRVISPASTLYEAKYLVEKVLQSHPHFIHLEVPKNKP